MLLKVHVRITISMQSTEGQDTGNAGNGTGQGAGFGSDIHRLSRTGDSLYQLLDIPKTSTNDEIRKKYRRLALKYHPDKNPENPEAEEMFKKINHANHILSDEKKRGLYDKYGSFGLHIAEQFGDDVVETLMMFRSGWFQFAFWTCCLLTGCYFCCCGCFCCCCCCGKCKPETDENEEVPDISQFENDHRGENEAATDGNDVITSQPERDNNTSNVSTAPSNQEAAADAPPPYTEVMEEKNSPDSTKPNETTALNSGDKVGYTPDMTESTTPKRVSPT